MKSISDNSAVKRLSKKPQINADKRRFINSKAYRFTGTHSETKFNKSLQSIRSMQSMVAKPFSLIVRNIQTLRNGTRITRIGRIFTDNSNPCASASSVQSVFYPNNSVNHVSAFICVHLRLNESNPIHDGYSKKWGEIYL